MLDKLEYFQFDRDMGLDSIPASVQQKFEIKETHHAAAILETDFPAEWGDLMEYAG